MGLGLFKGTPSDLLLILPRSPLENAFEMLPMAVLILPRGVFIGDWDVGEVGVE
jgi:hypothetical protein